MLSTMVAARGREEFVGNAWTDTDTSPLVRMLDASQELEEEGARPN